MGITWDEILIAGIIIIGAVIWCWFKTDYHIKYTTKEDMKKPLWWL